MITFKNLKVGDPVIYDGNRYNIASIYLRGNIPYAALISDASLLITENVRLDYLDFVPYKKSIKTLPGIKKVIFNGDRTIIIWADGHKTMVKCADDENFDYYTGFCAAIVKELFGSTAKAQKFMESVMIDQDDLYGANEEDDIFLASFLHKLYNLHQITEEVSKKRESLDIQNLTSDLCNKYGAKAVSEALDRYIANKAEV